MRGSAGEVMGSPWEYIILERIGQKEVLEGPAMCQEGALLMAEKHHNLIMSVGMIMFGVIVFGLILSDGELVSPSWKQGIRKYYTQ